MSAQAKTSVKETFTSIIIAFVFAFIFRGFVMEAFQIPTGSMAPTLLGAHYRHDGAETGFNFSLGRDYDRSVSAGPSSNATIADPNTRGISTMSRGSAPQTRLGDRIFVLKYLYSVFDPGRFDVVVFKYPGNPEENYIKRLIALPGEEPAFVDGDLFIRPADAPAPDRARPAEAWKDPRWKIARKPERIQRATWQTVFDASYTPLSALKSGATTAFTSPLVGEGWDTRGAAVYRAKGSGPSTLAWNSARTPIDDWYSYNQVGPAQNYFPVSDVALSMGVDCPTRPLTVTPTLTARGHQFQAVVTLNASGGAEIVLRMRPTDGDKPWKELAKADRQALPTDRPVTIDFWHADQALWVFLEGKKAAYAEYDFTPAERLFNATGVTLEQILADERSGVGGLDNVGRYRRPELTIGFSAGPVSLHRLRLDRDLYWRPGYHSPGGAPRPGVTTDPSLVHTPLRATHPLSTLKLGPNHFFVCGDNSPASYDGRMWQEIDKWVADEIDPTIGVVHRDLLIGKAFIVYFPSPVAAGKIPMIDFGRMRWIW